jgi:TonB family protein
MKDHLFFAAAMLVAAPVAAQPATPSAAASPSATKPCDPVAPEVGSDGEPIYTGCQIRALGGTFPKLVSTPARPDLSALHQQGIQGEARYSFVVGKDGRPHDAVVEVTSRSPELDAIGMELINKSIFFPALDHGGNPINTRVVSPTYFWKEMTGINEIPRKTCADFVIDARWHEANFPDEKPEEYRGWLLASGIIFTAFISEKRLKDLPRTPTYSEVMKTCKANPDKLFFEAFMGK